MKDRTGQETFLPVAQRGSTPPHTFKGRFFELWWLHQLGKIQYATPHPAVNARAQQTSEWKIAMKQQIGSESSERDETCLAAATWLGHLSTTIAFPAIGLKHPQGGFTSNSHKLNAGRHGISSVRECDAFRVHLQRT